MHNRKRPAFVAGGSPDDAGSLPVQPQTAKPAVSETAATSAAPAKVIGSGADRWGHAPVGADVEEG
jgi:hypothetical protein